MEAGYPATNQSARAHAPWPSSTGAMLRLFRERAGLSQEALAERAGLGLTTLKAVERDRRARPRPYTLARLADALGLTEAERDTLLGLASGVTAHLTYPGDESVAPDVSAGLLRLPSPPSPLIGRTAEVAAIRSLLDPQTGGQRLVTLVGPGGVGKTRVALAAAGELAERYPDGVVFVDLTPVRDPRLVAGTIARALALHEGSGRSARELLVATLRDRRALLVLDNFEQVLSAASLLADLLQECADLSLLVTSRMVLRLRAEHRFPIEPLAMPAEAGLSFEQIADSAAVRLFVDRAQMVASDFVLDADSAPAVAAACRRLEGLPLAIELAAARVSLLSPVALLRRLERRFGTLSLLTGGAPDLPERQHALRATLAWSHDLLAPGAQALFRRLAVFAGGWTFEAAEAVCADAEVPDEAVLDRLQMLVDSSLVRRLDDASGERRFSMLETIREYALEHLETHQELEGQSARLAAYFVALAEQAEPHLSGADQRAWFDRLDGELDNLRAALAWARSAGRREQGLRLALALAVFWEERGHVQEGCDWLETFVAGLADGDDPPHLAVLRARALATTAWLLFMQGDYRRAAPLAEESLARWRALGQVGNSPVALNTLGFVAHFDGDLARQEALFQESLALCRAEGDARGSAAVLGWLGTQRRASGDLDAATALLEESHRLYRTTGTIGGIAWALLHLGGVAADQGEVDRARALFEQSLTLYQSLGDRSDVAYATGALAGLAAGNGDVAGGRTLCEKSVAVFRQLGDVRGLTDELRLLGQIATLQHDDRAAVVAYTEYLTLSHAVSKMNLASSLQGLALALARTATHDDQPLPARLPVAVRLLGAAAALREALGVAPTGNWSVSQPQPDATDLEYVQQTEAARAALGDAAFESAWAEGRSLAPEQAVAYAVERLSTNR